MQQWLLLQEEGQWNPDPIKTFYRDLLAQISGWIKNGCKIILMMDMNENLGERPEGIGSLIRQHALIDMITLKHLGKSPPNTYTRGSNWIYYIFGTGKVVENCSEAGIIPFGYGYPSDHRAVFIRIKMETLLNSTISPMESRSAQKLQHATPNGKNSWKSSTITIKITTSEKDYNI
jgi:hypothetical protein